MTNKVPTDEELRDWYCQRAAETPDAFPAEEIPFAMTSCLKVRDFLALDLMALHALGWADELHDGSEDGGPMSIMLQNLANFARTVETEQSKWRT